MLYNPRSEEVNRDLLDAAQLIKDHGLCKNALVRRFQDNDVFCTRGALMLAIQGHLYWDQRSKDRLWRAEDRLLKTNNIKGDVPEWNNDPSRTKAEVVDALCKAAGVNAEVLV